MDGPKVIVPANCREIKPPICTPSCRVALIFGGSNNGYGYAAAEQLLFHGAKRVILADNNRHHGIFAERKLCKLFGLGRAKYYPCNCRDTASIDGLFKCTLCSEENISIVFNDLDAVHTAPKSKIECLNKDRTTNASRLTRRSLDMLKKQGCPAMLINCASLLGFMGWPGPDPLPVPVYCHGEPAIEICTELAKKDSEASSSETSQVRLIALCPTNSTLEHVGLPDIPDEVPKKARACQMTCSPDPCVYLLYNYS
ncbi:hypothetical protein QAD02_023642 [Eretmocerus hayati]|uniref:Uncharacterized protein n=1 Tax=Eretmocerus hayati TaxID=131215 RepID=A0ACC2PWJ7_9HYME|nr:hypothetical protein QAD02_023642 [Eretmocerus hayati]